MLPHPSIITRTALLRHRTIGTTSSFAPRFLHHVKFILSPLASGGHSTTGNTTFPYGTVRNGNMKSNVPRTFTRFNHHLAGELLVKDVLKPKERSRWVVEETETVLAATGKMVKENVGALVVARKGKPIGIITERDYLRKVIHDGRSSATTTVNEICTKDSNLIVAHVDDTLQDCVDAMGAKDIRHLPVARDGDIVGIISIRDIAKAFAKDRDKVFRKLEDIVVSYIHDG